MHQSDQNTDRQSATLPHPQQPELMTDQVIQENRANIFIQQLTVQRKFKFSKINYPTPAKTEILTSDPGPVFIQKSDSRSCSGFGKKCRYLPESTPVLRPCNHLCCKPVRS